MKESASIAQPSDLEDFSKKECFQLENQLCFALYVCSKEVIKRYKPFLDSLSLTYTGYITLSALKEKDEITVKDLGRKLYLDSGTLTPLLKRLEVLGYVKRIRSSADERNVNIKLTETGRQAQISAAYETRDLFNNSEFNKKDIEKLLNSLHNIMSIITKE